MAISVKTNQQQTTLDTDHQIGMDPYRAPEQLMALANGTNITTTILLDSSSAATEKAVLDWTHSQGIAATLQGEKLTIRLTSEDQGKDLLAKLYGLGSFGDAFELQRNLSRQGYLRNYHYGNVARPSVEGQLASQGQFTISNVSYERAYPFEGGTEPAVRYSINVKGKNIAIVIPADVADHEKYLKTLKTCFDKSSPSALSEVNVIRIDPKPGYNVTFKDETTGKVISSHAGASARTNEGIMTFYNGDVSENTYFHELAHFTADEFFNYFKSRNNPHATGYNSNTADPHTIWDYAIQNERNVPDHGNNNPRIEDFANSVEQWVQDPVKFTLAYPKRGVLIDEYVSGGGLVDRRHPSVTHGLGGEAQRKQILDLAQRLNAVLPNGARIDSADVNNGIVQFTQEDLVGFRIRIYSGWNAENRTREELGKAKQLANATASALPNFWSVSDIDLTNGTSQAKVSFWGVSGIKSITIDLGRSNWQQTLRDSIQRMNLPAIPPG